MNVAIHVEGYDDRAFVGGLLGHLGWTSVIEAAERDLYRRAAGAALKREPGVWYFVHEGRALALHPGKPGEGNKARVWDRALLAPLDPRQSVAVACVDCDVSFEEDDPASADRQRLADHRPTHPVELVAWHWKPGVTRPGVPKTQTLERLVLGVLSELDGSKGHGAIVERFLEEAPRAARLTAKHFAWATMAKWYGEHGCGDFYQALWKDEPFADVMLATLDAQGTLAKLRAALSG